MPPVDSREFHDLFHPASIFGAALLGALIGAFYEWQGRGHPFNVWLIGSSFIFMLAIYSDYTNQTIHGWEPAAARQGLWTVTMLSLFGAKRARQLFEYARAERRSRRVTARTKADEE